VLSLRIIARRSDGLITLELMAKIIFHRKLTDLTVLVLSLLDLVQEDVGNAFNCLPYTRTHLRRMKLALGCDLLHRLVTA